jgi:hypothetical protein
MSANNMLGAAGVHRVASELLFRGYHVLFPASDQGVDLFTEEGHGIQVKTAHTCRNFYHFHFRFWTCKAGEKKQRYGRIHPRVTHLILWCVDDNQFVIIGRDTFPEDPNQIVIPTYRLRGTGSNHGRPFRWQSNINDWEALTRKPGIAAGLV